MNQRLWKKYMWAYIFILPQLVFFLVFTIYPILMSYVYSLYDWPGFGPMNKFVFLGNFQRLLADSSFWNAFRNNMIYIALQTVIVLPISLIAAIVLNFNFLKGRTVYRTVYFLPVVTTTAIIGVVMKFIFGNDQALANNLLMAIGMIDQPINWLAKPVTAMAVLIGVGIWKMFGFTMVFWLAGLQSLPADAYEAAEIDGAGFWKAFRYITLPLLVPIGAVILLLTVVNGMHVFDLVMTLTGGGPFFGTDMVDLYIYRYAFGNTGMPQMGYASAAGTLFGISIFIITLILGGLVRWASMDKKSKAVQPVGGVH